MTCVHEDDGLYVNESNSLRNVLDILTSTFLALAHSKRVFTILKYLRYHWYCINDTVSLIPYQSITKWAPISVFSTKKGDLIVSAISILVGPPGLLTKSLGAVTGFVGAAQLFPWECRWGLHKDCDDVDDDLFNTYAVPHAWALLGFPLKFTDAWLTPAMQWTNAPMQQNAICNLASLNFAILGTCKVVAFHNL